MKQKGKMVLISLVVLIALFSVFLIFLMNSLESFQKNKTEKYKGTNEDIIQYVKDTHDVDVDIVDNRGSKNFNDSGGATVRTTDERELAFNIEISMFNNIKSDTYKEESGVYSMNKALQSSGDIEELAGIGADSVDIQLPDTLSSGLNYDPFFYFDLTEEIRLSSKETIQVVNEVLPVAEKWRETAKNKYKLDMEEIHFVAYDDEDIRQTVRLNVEKAPKNSLEELEQQLLEKNIDAFTQHLVKEEVQKIAYLEDQFDTLQFSNSDNKEPLKCNQIQKLNECESYTLFVSYPNRTSVEMKREFRYDDPKVKEMLFETIQMVNESDSPINQLSIDLLYRPSDLENQYETEEELRAKSEKRIHFDLKKTMIKNLSEIEKVDDIIFEE